MVDIIDIFSLEVDCIYKDEHYSVRDNGAIMRHARKGMRKRKLDNVWSFGTPNMATGYMEFGGERVHRIVALAFHGNPPTDQHVVDHIDTNRRNNRPENLRWLTKLENILCNEITRKKVEMICGSIEAFLENPQLLYGHETIDNNFSWMKSVSKEEAQYCLDNWSHWAKTAKPNPNYKKTENHISEWMYKNSEVPYPDDNPLMRRNVGVQNDTIFPEAQILTDDYEDYNEIEEREPLKTQSLTPNAVQLDWRNPVTFHCCPQEFSGNPLEAYMANMKEGDIFSSNKFGDSTILKCGMPQPDCLWVMCRVSIGWKTHAFTKITFEDGIFYHENMGLYDFGDDPEKIFESILKGERA